MLDVANARLASRMLNRIDDRQAEKEELDELTRSMARRRLSFERQKPLPIAFHGTKMVAAYRLDFVVERAVVVEIKAIDRVLPVHRAQILSYVKLSGGKVGLLVNFRRILS